MATLTKKATPRSQDSAIANTLRMAALAADKKATDFKAYDVRGLTLIADTFIICTVHSTPQMKAVLNAVKEGMKEIGVAPLHCEGGIESNWLLMDYGEIILHLFREKARSFYDLDGLWADAKTIDLDLED